MKKTFVIALALLLTPSLFAQNWSKDLEKQAKKGDATAQYQIGVSYLNGNGIDGDPKKAAKFLSMAASQGHKEARQQLFTFYSKELEKLAKSGDAEAQFALGNAYYEGKGCDKDTDDAAKWFGLAAGQGHAAATKKLFSYDNRTRNEMVVATRLYKNSWAEAVHYGLSKFDLSENKNTKDPYCEIYYNHGSTQEIHIYGERNGDVISGVLIFLDSHVYFQGDFTVGNCCFTLHKGGTFSHAEYEGSHKLTEDYRIDISLTNRYHFVLPEQPKITFTNRVKVPKEKIREKWNELIRTYRGRKSDLFLNYSGLTDFVESHSGLTTMEYDAMYTLKSSEFTEDQWSGAYLQESVLNKVYLGNNCVLSVFSNGNSVGAYAYTDQNGDAIRWGIFGSVLQIHKKLDDCVINFDMDAEDSEIIYNNGDRFKGAFDFGCVDWKGKPRQTDPYYIHTIIEENKLKKTWSAKNSKELNIVYHKGVLTDKNGKSTEYINGMPRAEFEKKQKEQIEQLKKQLKEFIELFKERCSDMKEALLQEGYNAKEVTDLVDNCVIYKGMSADLIERAIEMQGNVMGSITINPTLFDQQKVITIYDKKTLQVVFQQVVEYNKITRTVQRVASTF